MHEWRKTPGCRLCDIIKSILKEQLQHMLQGKKQKNLKASITLQNQMKTFSSKLGPVDNKTNIQMETERFWLSCRLFQTYGQMLSHQWSIWMLFFVTFHPHLGCALASTSQLFMRLSSSLISKPTACFPPHSFHFPAQAPPRRRTKNAAWMNDDE